MKKIQLLILFIFSFTIGLFAQGIVKEKQVIKSAILNKEVHYSIYLPSDYNTSERAYPVTYLLHGYGDADDGWIQFGEINRLADEGIATGKMPPMIIVTPDGFTSFYINSADGAMNYEDFFIKELIPHIEKTYKVKAERKYRGIAGLSMGGYGALIYALKYPNLFTAAAPLSAAVWTDTDIINLNDNMYNTLFGSAMGKNLKGKDRLTASWLENSPMGIIEKKTVAELSTVKYWIDCGDDDFLTVGNSALHIALTNKKVPHEFRMRDGSHNWTYWRTGIIDALSFIGDSFRQK
jgi:S-formylglutathione hydrolase FrmB